MCTLHGRILANTKLWKRLPEFLMQLDLKMGQLADISFVFQDARDEMTYESMVPGL